jgi:hypothetical protein
LVAKDYQYDTANVPGLQTTVAFGNALEKFQEDILNKVRLRDVQICHMRVGGNYRKNP